MSGAEDADAVVHARQKNTMSTPIECVDLCSSDEEPASALASGGAVAQPALQTESHEEYEVEAILGETNGKFLVKWKGYAESEATWERAALCAGCPELIDSFRAADQLKKLRAAVAMTGRKRTTRHALRARAALWHSSAGEFPVHMEDVTSLVCEHIDEARDLCAVALVCKAWLHAARRAVGYRVLLEVSGKVGGMIELPNNRLVSFAATPFGSTLLSDDDAPATRGGQFDVWDLSTGAVVSTVLTTEPITAIELLPFERLAVATFQSEIRRGRWNNYVVEIPCSRSLRVYSLSSGTVQFDIPLREDEISSKIGQLLSLPTTNRLAVVTRWSLTLYDLETGVAATQLVHLALPLNGLVALPGGSFVGSRVGGLFSIFNAAGALQNSFQVPASYSYYGPNAPCQPIMMPGSQTEMLVGQYSDADGDCPIACIDIATGETQDPFYGHRSRHGRVKNLVALPGSSLFASYGPVENSAAYGFKIWTVEDGGSLLRTLKNNAESTSSLSSRYTSSPLMLGISGGRLAAITSRGIAILRLIKDSNPR